MQLQKCVLYGSKQKCMVLRLESLTSIPGPGGSTVVCRSFTGHLFSVTHRSYLCDLQSHLCWSEVLRTPGSLSRRWMYGRVQVRLLTSIETINNQTEAKALSEFMYILLSGGRGFIFWRFFCESCFRGSDPCSLFWKVGRVTDKRDVGPNLEGVLYEVTISCTYTTVTF